MATRVRHGPPPTSEPVGRNVFAPAFDLSDSKLHAPVARPGIVYRTAVVDRMVAQRTPPVISVVAPPGYGKTTLLAQWAQRKRSRVGWVSADDQDNDPVVLLTYIAVALHGVERIDPAVFRSLTASGAGIKGPRQLVSAIATMRRPVALVLDHLEAVTNQDSLDAIAALALGLPNGSQLAIGSRARVAASRGTAARTGRHRGDRN